MKTTNWNRGMVFRKSHYTKSMLWVCMLLTMGFIACKYEDLTMPIANDNMRPAGDFIQNNYDTQLFYAALKKTGYAKEINTAGPFTVLVPKDQAFNEIGVFRASDFDKISLDSLRRVIGYHILPRRLYVQDIPTNSIDVRYVTLEGTELYASLGSDRAGQVGENDRLYFSGAKASRRDVAIANGVIHILDKVMKPQFEVSIQQWLTNRSEYSVFVAGLKKFGLWDELADKGPFTVFAPTNEALEKLGITQETLTDLSPEKYDAAVLFGAYIMYYKHIYISDGMVFTKINSKYGFSYKLRDNKHIVSFSASEEYPLWLLGFGISIRAGNGPFDHVIGNTTSNIQADVDFLCSNGLIHKINKGLLTPLQAIKK